MSMLFSSSTLNEFPNTTYLHIQKIIMVVSSGVKVLGTWYSPFVNRVQIALNLKSVDYEFVQENLTSKSELLLKSNPVLKKVPVLIHGDNSVSESLIIVQYIDESWNSRGPSILPSDPYDRAVARFWAAYIDDKFLQLLRDLRTAKEEEKTGLVERINESLVLLEDAFLKCSKGKEYFGGDSIGYLDIALGCSVVWLEAIEKNMGIKLLDKIKTPELTAWAHRFVKDDAVKVVIPQTDKIVELLKGIQARANASSK